MNAADADAAEEADAALYARQRQAEGRGAFDAPTSTSPGHARRVLKARGRAEARHDWRKRQPRSSRKKAEAMTKMARRPSWRCTSVPCPESLAPWRAASRSTITMYGGGNSTREVDPARSMQAVAGFTRLEAVEENCATLPSRNASAVSAARAQRGAVTICVLAHEANS